MRICIKKSIQCCFWSFEITVYISLIYISYIHISYIYLYIIIYTYVYFTFIFNTTENFVLLLILWLRFSPMQGPWAALEIWSELCARQILLKSVLLLCLFVYNFYRLADWKLKFKYLKNGESQHDPCFMFSFLISCWRQWHITFLPHRVRINYWPFVHDWKDSCCTNTVITLM